jgi:general secretion pathway protein G
MKTSYARRAVTLIEIIIVMILIATITGALAMSYKGTLEKGYAFKTEQGMRKIEAILNIYYAEHPEDMASCSTLDWKKIVLDSPLIRPNDTGALYDGWGVQYAVKMEPDQVHGGVTIEIYSKALENFKNKRKK